VAAAGGGVGDMMESLHQLGLGFAAAFTLANIGWCFAGALIGTLIGVLPGVGPVAAIAMLLPAMHALDATAPLILLARRVLRRAARRRHRGEPARAPTSDGVRRRAARGRRAARTGAALVVATSSSFVRGCGATLAIALAAGPLLRFAADLDSTGAVRGHGLRARRLHRPAHRARS
jgi:TctA family transporter